MALEAGMAGPRGTQPDEWMQRVFRPSLTALEVFDVNGRLLEANASCLALFGVTDPREIQGADLFADPNLGESERTALQAGQPVTIRPRSISGGALPSGTTTLLEPARRGWT